MKYHKTITLKDGRTCMLRNGTAEDGRALLKIFNLTHTQTDYLRTYPEEHSYTAEDEAELLRRNRPVTTLFMLMSVDGKISTGAADELDVDRDFPKITGLREGLHQYYEIEQTTDLWSFNNTCSFATVSPDGKCPNAVCCQEKGIDGCYECGLLETCEKGFYAPSNDVANAARAQAMYIINHGKQAFLKMHDRLHEKYDFSKAQEILSQDFQEAFRILEES